MQRVRTSLVGVFLCLACACASIRDIRCTRDLTFRIHKIRQEAQKKMWLNCSLYTPTVSNYMQRCPGAALRCFSYELKVLTEECDITDPKLILDGKLEKMSDSFSQMESECLQCEVLRAEQPEQFLNNLQSVVQKMNSEFC